MSKYYIHIPSNALDQFVVEAESAAEAGQKFHDSIDCKFVQTIECDLIEEGAANYPDDAVRRAEIFDSDFQPSDVVIQPVGY